MHEYLFVLLTAIAHGRTSSIFQANSFLMAMQSMTGKQSTAAAVSVGKYLVRHWSSRSSKCARTSNACCLLLTTPYDVHQDRALQECSFILFLLFYIDSALQSISCWINVNFASEMTQHLAQECSCSPDLTSGPMKDVNVVCPLF